MKISNLNPFYIYKRLPKKVDGETTIQWQYKGMFYLNDQQDINDLDKTSSGIVDFDTLKLRVRREVDIQKKDGVSYIKLDVDDTGLVINGKPEYTVENTNKIGRSRLFTCKTYNGE